MWIVVGTIVLLFGGLGILLWQGARERRETERELERIKALSPSAARSLALRLQGDGALFQCKLAEGTGPLPELPPSVAELLTLYEEVVHGEFWIGRTALSQSSRTAGYRKIGEDFEFTEVLVRPYSDAVYLSYGEQPPEETPEVVPTAWHLIIQASGVRL